MDKYIWVIVSFIAGAILPIQAAINTKMGKTVHSPIMASLISFMVGILAIVVFLIVSRQGYSLKGLRDAPAYTWIGGILGAFYVTVIVYAFPKIGPGLTFGLVVAGQLGISLLLEHFQLLGAQAHPISLGRVVGMLLIVAGVVIIKRF